MRTSFKKRVYEVTARVPRGKVATYADISLVVLGNPRGARAVGSALNKNPDTKKTPCHRVIRSDGTVGGYAFGTNKKTKKLLSEGVVVERGRVNLEKFKIRLIK